jgi:hypothetical protein
MTEGQPYEVVNAKHQANSWLVIDTRTEERIAECRGLKIRATHIAKALNHLDFGGRDALLDYYRSVDGRAYDVSGRTLQKRLERHANRDNPA